MTQPTRAHPTQSAEADTASARVATAPTIDEGGSNGDRRQLRGLAPVIRSKIQPPPLRSSTLSRKRLLDRLVEAVEARLTLLVAEAGYGKTTLLADFSAHAGLRCLWYKLDSTDADAITWTNHVIAAAREIDPNFGRSTLSLLSQTAPGGPPKSVFVASLLGELPQLGEAPTLLVLDDFHAVDKSAEARDYVVRLIRDAPPWLRFVISSRRRPSLEMARLAGMGDLIEIGTDDLRFSREETERLFADSYGIALEADVLRDVDARTQGWAASLQLFHGSIRGRPSSAIRALARSLSGAASPVYDFLAEEVLSNTSAELERFLIRAALLDRIVPGHVVALFASSMARPDLELARQWIEEADRIGLLARTSRSSEARQLHPLLRDFLLRQLQQRSSPEEIREMHLRLARAIADADPLTACRHFIEAADHAEAMRCLGSSVMLTMGSGQWGVASDLIDRLEGVPADPAVAAIRARRLIEEGDLGEAARLLEGIDVASSPPEVRAVFRHAKLSLGWRTGDRDLLFATLQEFQEDRDTPPVLRDIAQIFVDASPLSSPPAPLPSLARRLVTMSDAQTNAGHDFYAAVSLHNAAVAQMNAGSFRAALDDAEAALIAFERLPFSAPERFSTHSVMATCQLEIGDRRLAEEHIAEATTGGEQHADVEATLAFAAIAIGDRKRASDMIGRAENLHRDGRSDLVAAALTDAAKSLAALPTNPAGAIQRLEATSVDGPLDFGHKLARQTLLAQAWLLVGDRQRCLTIAETSLTEARARVARRSEARLTVLAALARRDRDRIHQALVTAVGIGHLALAELADAIGHSLDLLMPVPIELEENILLWPMRWLPILRRQLDRGDVPTGHAASRLLDRYGEIDDVLRLRAYAKTYRGRAKTPSLGTALARRVSPRLEIHDLGRVSITVGTRTIALTGFRRKAAALLMYLVTRPGFAANRDQVLDELWPESDPASASNSLNQSLYFLRRELDPWYEDDLSVDYVALQGDLVWLDPALVTVDSAAFMASARESRGVGRLADDVISVLTSYGGPFAPEFEYEEWAIMWRSRVHSTFLELASSSVDRLAGEGDFAGARDVAMRSLESDPSNPDLERQLIWLYWHLGAKAAATAQYQHLANQERADGLEPLPLSELVSRPTPG